MKRYVVTETRTRQIEVEISDGDCQAYGEPQAALVKALDYESEGQWADWRIAWAVEKRQHPT